MAKFSLASASERFGTAADYLTLMARLARDFPRHLRHPIGPDDAVLAVKRRLASREARFLALVEQAIYANPSSPYRALLRMAGCEPGDVRELVRGEGVEGTLDLLAARGVYVAFDELQGRRDIVRGSQRFAVREGDFENPLARPHVAIFGGGSAGRPRRFRSSLSLLAEWATSIATVLAAHGVDGPRWAFWWTFPATWIGVTGSLGHPVAGWFYPVHPLPLAARLAGRYLALLGRLSGYQIPRPTYADATHPEGLLDWMVIALGDGQPLVMLGTPSAAVRLAILAGRRGVTLRGLTLLVVGEPITEARRRDIEASGAQVIPSYSSTDAAGISYGCATPLAADDVHLMLDRFALVQRERQAMTDGPTVPAGLVTCFSLQSSRVMLNAELGDSMRIEERDCSCALGALGLRVHLSEIRSFEKLTGEGVTFARSRLVQIVEDVLPARFGGNSLDYQLAEEEATNSATRLVLRVCPSVGPIDDVAVRDAFLQELGRGSLVDQYQAELWRGAGTVTVRREAPLATAAGKVLPFHLLKRPPAAQRSP